jgi:endonuclease-3
MLKSERAKFIIDRLESIYPKTPIPLNNNNNFELLVAVLLSAQCTDERVNRVTPILFSIANNPFEMEKVDLKVIYDIIRPCGLAPKKSKAIQDLSKILVDKFDGIVPKDINELEKLPGVGHKTASVVISQGFGLPAFPVDTHIHRLAQRWGLTNGKNVKQTEKDLKKLFPTERWSKLHLQIIFYGREFCSAWSCDGTICEICTTCYPKRKKPFRAKKS